MIQQFTKKILNVDFPSQNHIILNTYPMCDQLINIANSGIRSLSSSMVNGKDVYFFSGNTSNDQVTVKYDMTTNTWSTITVSGTPPTARSYHGGGYINNALYIFGGYYSGDWRSDIHKLDLNTNAWSGALSPAGSIPSKRGYVFSNTCVCSDKLYVISGYNGVAWLTEAYCYDPAAGAAGTWTALAAPTYAPTSGAATSYGGYVYLVCAGATKNYLLRYDPVGDSWTTLSPCPNKGYYFTLTATDEGILHLLGGYNIRDGAYQSTTTTSTNELWWAYNIAEDRWYAKPQLNWQWDYSKNVTVGSAYAWYYHSAASYSKKLFIFYPYWSGTGTYKGWTICIPDSTVKKYIVAEVERGV